MHHEGNLRIWNAEDARRYRGVTSVGGHLFIDAQVALPALTSVGGNLFIRAEAELPALTSVGGSLTIDAKAALPVLTSVGDYLAIDTKAELPALTTVGGYLEIRAQADLPALTTVGDLDIYAKADLPALTSVGGYPLPDAATAEANLRKIAPLALKEGALKMSSWHCGASHCIAGWGQHAILGKTDSDTASIDGTRALGLEATKHFYVSDDEAREFLRQYT